MDWRGNGGREKGAPDSVPLLVFSKEEGRESPNENIIPAIIRSSSESRFSTTEKFESIMKVIFHSKSELFVTYCLLPHIAVPQELP